MGKTFYRQKVGIPQGSVVSTVLCNMFYAHLEKKKLPFLQDADGILLRLIDDFLFITMNRDHAQQFLQLMHDGKKTLKFSDERSSRVWMFRQYVQELDKLWRYYKWAESALFATIEMVSVLRKCHWYWDVGYRERCYKDGRIMYATLRFDWH